MNKGLLLVLALAAPPARAACPVDVIPHALAARIDATGISMMKGILLEQLPASLPIPTTPNLLLDCPSGFDDTVVTPLGGEAYVHVDAATLTLGQGTIDLDIQLRVEAETDLALQLCALPDADCHAGLEAQDIRVHARVEPHVDACQLTLPVTELSVDIDDYATMVRLTDCGLYDDMWQLVYDWFRGFVISLVTSKIEDMVQTELPAFVDLFTGKLAANDMVLMGLAFKVAVEAVTVTPSGVRVEAAANVTPVDAPAPCLPPGAALPDEPTPATSAALSDDMISLAAAQPFLSRAVRAAWLSGLLCLDTRALGLDLSQQLAGISPGASLDATLVINDAPNLTLMGGAVQLGAKSVDANLLLTTPDSAIPINVHMGVRASLHPDIDDAIRAVTVALVDLQSDGMQINMPSVALAFTPEAVARLVENTLLPALTNKVGALPVTSGLLVTAPVALHLDAVSVNDTHLRADLRLWPIDRNDVVAPVTVVLAPPPLPSGQDAVVELGSVDDRTPADFLRHWVAIDEVWEATPRAGSTLHIKGLADGRHSLAISALDLSGNADGTPLVLEVWIDGVAPLVTITDQPYGVLSHDDAELDFVALDDWSSDGGVALRYTAGLISPDLLPDTPFAAGPLSHHHTLVIKDLPEDALVRVTIFATDEAGNEGSASTAFAVDRRSTFSCQSGNAGLGAWAALVLLVRRRRRR